MVRRAAVSLVGAGWILFGAPGLGDSAAVRGAALSTQTSDLVVEDGSLRSAGLSGITVGLVPIPLVDPSAPQLHSWHPHDGAWDMTQFVDDAGERLPQFRTWFEQAGERSGLDWRLLAAMAYQESNWDPTAVSPTGVRGIMMLTLGTAEDMGVERDDPAQCIEGGAEYFAQILEHLPLRIHEPDRTDMALAAWNQGIGHLLDARVLAAQQGGSPNRWQDVRSAMLLLGDEQWASAARYGADHGEEAASFVNKVHAYYRELKSLAPDAPPPSIEIASDKV
jgi:soluble lytic murein transglycosylase-like protein